MRKKKCCFSSISFRSKKALKMQTKLKKLLTISLLSQSLSQPIQNPSTVLFSFNEDNSKLFKSLPIYPSNHRMAFVSNSKICDERVPFLLLMIEGHLIKNSKTQKLMRKVSPKRTIGPCKKNIKNKNMRPKNMEDERFN